MKKIVVLNGIHSSGKTSVGHYMQNKGYIFHPEIAMEIHEKGGKIGANAIDIQIRIMKQENFRGESIRNSDKLDVIESWHSAGLAHAVINEPRSVNLLESNLEENIKIYDPLILYLSVDPSVILKRGSLLYPNVDEEIIEFYDNLDKNFRKIFSQFGMKTKMIEANQKLEDVCRLAEQAAYQHLK